MKTIIILLGIASLACIGSKNVDGWGWFLFVGVLISGGAYELAKSEP
jgi:hypothetical protein